MNKCKLINLAVKALKTKYITISTNINPLFIVQSKNITLKLYDNYTCKHQ